MKEKNNTSIGRREVLLFLLLIFTVIGIITIEKYEATYMLEDAKDLAIKSLDKKVRARKYNGITTTEINQTSLSKREDK